MNQVGRNVGYRNVGYRIADMNLGGVLHCRHSQTHTPLQKCATLAVLLISFYRGQQAPWSVWAGAACVFLDLLQLDVLLPAVGPRALAQRQAPARGAPASLLAAALRAVQVCTAYCTARARAAPMPGIILMVAKQLRCLGCAP